MALPNPNIQLGAPPLLWSDVQTAFTRVNENFDSVAAALGVAGLTPIDFETLDTNVSPTTDSEYSLGSSTNKWSSVYTSEYSTVPGEELNGVWLGTAHIKGIGGTVDLPLSSTIDGSLIIDPNKTTFKIVNVEGEGEIIASSFTDTLNFVNGTAIRLTVNSSSDSIIFDNTGVIKVSGTAGQIGVTATGPLGTGEITLTNLGVVSLLSTTALPSGRTEGVGININAANGSNIKITNTGVLSISSVTASLTVTPNAATGNVELENLLPAYPAFGNIVANAGLISAVGSSSGTTLNIAEGYGIALSTNNTTKTLTVAVNPAFDLKGSVFADDSTVMVNAIDRTFLGDLTGSVFANDSTQLIDGDTATVYGNIEATTLRTSEPRIVLGYLAGSIGGSGAAITIGSLAGATNQGTGAMAIGPYAGQTNQGISGMAIGPYAGYTGQGLTTLAVGAYAGQTNQGNVALAIGAFAGNDGQGTNAVAIGPYAGGTNQGAGSIAIGLYAGSLNQSANSIVLNASGVALNGSAAGLYIDPIRSTATATGPVMYNPTTKELFYNTVLEFAGSTISTNDSSGINVDVQTTFKTNVTVDGDLQLNGDNIIYGSGTAGNHGYGIIQLVPDPTLETNNQYLVIDPTGPNHIHIRAGGPSDASNVELRVGGEITYFSVWDGGNNTNNGLIQLYAKEFHIAASVYGDVQDVTSVGATVDLSADGAITGNIIYANPLAAQDIIIPDAPAEVGKRYVISNGNGASTITLKDASANTITTIGPDSAKEVISNGYSWQVL